MPVRAQVEAVRALAPRTARQTCLNFAETHHLARCWVGQAYRRLAADPSEMIRFNQ